MSSDYHEAGRRLLAVMTSHRLGLSLDYTLKNHVPDVVDEDWERLAALLDRCMADEFGSKLSERNESTSLLERLKLKLTR